jgi:hypothetical protein
MEGELPVEEIRMIRPREGRNVESRKALLNEYIFCSAS